jgi:CheY-like chemotaxis protein
MGKPFFLLADDDEDDRFFFSMALKSVDPDIQCVMVSNGMGVLTMLQNDFFSFPDYIFLDLNMPLLDGLQCLEAIKKNTAYRAIPVIMYSTTMDKATSRKLMKAGALACFVKPSSPAKLADVVQKLCKM